MFEGQRDLAEERLKRLAIDQMDANATNGLAHAGSEFKEVCAQLMDPCRAPGLRQLKAKQVDQVAGEAVQEQPEGVGQETMTAETVGAKAVLELLDAVLAIPTIVVESKNAGGTTVQLVMRSRRLVPVAG